MVRGKEKEINGKEERSCLHCSVVASFSRGRDKSIVVKEREIEKERK